MSATLSFTDWLESLSPDEAARTAAHWITEKHEGRMTGDGRVLCRGLWLDLADIRKVCERI